MTFALLPICCRFRAGNSSAGIASDMPQPFEKEIMLFLFHDTFRPLKKLHRQQKSCEHKKSCFHFSAHPAFCKNFRPRRTDFPSANLLLLVLSAQSPVPMQLILEKTDFHPQVPPRASFEDGETKKSRPLCGQRGRQEEEDTTIPLTTGLVPHSPLYRLPQRESLFTAL